MPFDFFDPDLAPEAHRGLRNYEAGLCAEDVATRYYRALGYDVLAKRWRGQGGEIDLIVAKDGLTVFVEVKASKDFASAASHIGPRQLARVCASAEEFMAGALADMRIDAALVDAMGRIEILENITL